MHDITFVKEVDGGQQVIHDHDYHLLVELVHFVTIAQGALQIKVHELRNQDNALVLNFCDVYLSFLFISTCSGSLI